MPAAAVLVVNNYRDHESDRIVGKNTLAVRMGPRASQLEYALLMFGPFVLLLWLQFLLGSLWLLLPLLVLPWAIILVRRVYTEAPGPALNRVLAATAQMQLAKGLTLCLALFISMAGTRTNPHMPASMKCATRRMTASVSPCRTAANRSGDVRNNHSRPPRIMYMSNMKTKTVAIDLNRDMKRYRESAALPQSSAITMTAKKRALKRRIPE